jgi:surface adhesion protein
VYTVKIPAGASSAQFNVATIDDKITEGTENFVVKIDLATGGNREPAVSSTNGSVSTSIIDNDAHRSSTWMPTTPAAPPVPTTR